MHKSLKLMLALIIGLFTVPVMGSTVFADGIADGEYEVGVTALEDGSDDVSVADDFVHDATLTVENGNPSLTLGIGASGGDYSDFDFSIEWMTVDGQEPVGESEEGDFTYYTFQLNSVESVVPAQMEYVVPDFPALADGHEVAFDMELSNLPEGESGGTPGDQDNDNNGDNETNGTENTEGNNNDSDDNGNGTVEDNGSNGNGTTDGEQEDNPQTGESSNIGLYSILLIVALTPLAIQLKRRFSINK